MRILHSATVIRTTPFAASLVLAGILFALVAGAPPARAQNAEPFSLREGGETPVNPGASGLQQGIQGGTALSPGAARVLEGRQAERAPGPPQVPFDVNGDGRAPTFVLPADQMDAPISPTTTSVLSNGNGAPSVRQLNAISKEQRAELTRLLKQSTDEVSELRVNIANDLEWVDSVTDRPIAPYRTLRLDGEIDSAAFSVFLSAAEASRGGTLAVAFTNSVLVLPEASRLRVFLNGRQIAQTAIDSPDRTKVIALPVSSDLLRPGENALRFEADMRHRIDCSLTATFELWTRIDTRLTGFSFGGGPIALTNLSDLPAVGVGTNGATRIRVLQKQPSNPTNIDRMLRAVQAAALRGRFVQPLVEVVSGDTDPEASPGTLNIAIGTYDNISRIAPEVPAEGATGPVAALIDNDEIGPTLVITGPSERAVDAALAQFDTPLRADRPASPIEATPPWLVQNEVRVDRADRFTLSEAGVETINFSGRRFSTQFTLTLPPDFYAAAYGEARLLLDAAYSSDVEPGSTLSVFVNGVLSTSIAFTSSNGEVLEDFPVVLVMKNFRPGINTVELVVDLETAADRACLPGGTVPARDRFALFSTTSIVFPEFARIGQLPNLASFATNGFPYPFSSEPVRVFVGGNSPDTIGAAGTLIARVAVSRGSLLSTNVVEDTAPFEDAGLIIVAPLADVSSLALETTGAARIIPSTWLQPFGGARTGTEPEGLERYDDVLRRLRQQLRQEEVRVDRPDFADGDSLSGRSFDQRNETQRSQQRWFEELSDENLVSRVFSNIVDSVRGAVNLDFAVGSAGDSSLGMALISDDATLLMAQSQAPANPDTAWTLVTAPTPQLLSTSMAALSAPEEWQRIGGRITAYELESNDLTTVPVDRVSYLATLPLSLANIRLIAANWFSINNGVYAIALVVMAFFLGLATWALIRPLGRRNE